MRLATKTLRVLCVWAVVMMSQAHGQTTYYWNATGTSSPAAGGDGSWDTSASNWRLGTDAGSSAAWINSSTSNAVFAGTAGTVMLSGSIAANSVTFSTTGYSLASGTLWLQGTTPTLSLGSGITGTISSEISGTSGLTKSGAGTLALVGSSTYTGNTTIKAGGIAMQGTVSSTTTTLLTIGDTASTKAMMTLSGTFAGSRFSLGSAGSAVGVLTQTAGSRFVMPAAGNVNYLGISADGYGAWVMAGGSASIGQSQYGSGGNGVFSQSGGSVAATDWQVYARWAGSRGVGTITGGTFTQVSADRRLVVGEGGTGVLTVAGTGFVEAVGQIWIAQNAGSVGTLNLNGGTVLTPYIGTGATPGDSTLAFNGGTLRARAASTSFLQGLNRTFIYSDGATIDTNGVGVTIAQNLQAPSGNGVSSIAVTNGGTGYIAPPIVTIAGGGGAGATAIANVDANGVVIGITITNSGTGYTGTPTVSFVGGGGSGAQIGSIATSANISGGLTKVGAGTLTLSGSSTYAGATRITSGTLALATNGSISNSGTIEVGTASSSGVVLDLTAKTDSFAFGANQTVSGIGTLNIGAGKTVSAAGMWAPGNSIGSNAVTGNLTLTGTSRYELGSPGSGTASPGKSDFTAVSGTLTLGGSLTLIDNAEANGGGSYGGGAYRLFTYGVVSGSYSSITPANASTRAAVAYGGSGTSTGQGVFLNVYNLAVGSLPSGTSVSLGLIHAGASFMPQSVAIGNAAAPGSFSEGLDAFVSGSTGAAAWGGAGITNLLAGGTSSTITASLGNTATGGVKNGTLTIGYQSNGAVSGLSTISTGSQVVSITGSVFSGAGTWNVNGGGAWGTGASVNWTSVDSVAAAPGTFAGYANSDSAMFGNALAGGTGSILLNGATPSLAAIVFSNTTGRYVLGQGSAGSLTLAAAAGKPTVDVVAGGLHEISVAIQGTDGLNKLGSGSLVLSGSNGFSGATDISAGLLAVNGSLTGAVNVASGASLGGAGVVGGVVTVAGGGAVAPGNSPGTLTMTAGLSLADASLLNFELSATDFTVGGGINDLIAVTGNFTLDGILNVTGLGDFSAVADNTKWRLFDYSGGEFTNNGIAIGIMPSVGATGKYFQVDTATPGQVNLVIVPEPGAFTIVWIGAVVTAIARRRLRSVERAP